MLPQEDSHQDCGPNDTNLGTNEARDPKCLEAETPRRVNLGRGVWRQKVADQGKRAADQESQQQASVDNPNTSGSRPLAQAGERSPPKSAARPTDSTTIQPSQDSSQQLPHPTRDGPLNAEPNTPLPARKLVAAIPAALLASLRSKCSEKASVSLLGRIQGKHPGLKALSAWARENLHPSLAFLSLKSNNLFEVTFDRPEGRTHALHQSDLACESAAIFFSNWRPHFDPTAPHAEAGLDYPVWVQIVDLCQVLREEEFLRTIGDQIGQMISIDTSDVYKAKLFGPRIRLLVQDITALPQTVVVPGPDWTVKE